MEEHEKQAKDMRYIKLALTAIALFTGLDAFLTLILI